MSDLKAFPLSDVIINYDSRRIPVLASERKRGPYPYYGASGIVDNVDGYLFDGEYLLIAEDGENLRTRKTPIAFVATGKFWVNNHAHVVQGNHCANTRYLAYTFAQTDISGYLSGSTQPKLTQAAMNRIEVRLPERDYQDSVVEVLGAFDEKIAKNGLIVSTADSLLAAHFGSAMEDASREVKLREVVGLRYGKALKEEDRIFGRIPVFGGNGVSGWHDTPLESGPGIIVGRKGANAGSVSWSPGPFWAIDTSFYIEPASCRVPLEFLLYLLKNAGFRNLVGDSAIPGLNREIALGIIVNLPPDDVVARFSDVAGPLLSMNAQLAEESRSMVELRDALLPKLMSGEICVRDAEKVVEDVVL